MSFRTSRAALVVVMLAAGGVLFAFDPIRTSWFPSCPLYALTGWLCPFCGTLRAGHALLHGHVETAFTLNPLMTAAAAAAAIAAIHDRARPGARAIGPRLASFYFSRPAAALAVAFGVLRNLHRVAG